MRETPHTAVLYSSALADSKNQTDMGTIRREGPGCTGNPQRLYVRDHLDRREIKIKSSLLGNLEDQLSEIPCRVDETARSASDRTHQPAQIGGTLPARAAPRAIPRVRSRRRDPRNDSGVRSLDGAEAGSIRRRL
jgi:hypothetical protein